MTEFNQRLQFCNLVTIWILAMVIAYMNDIKALYLIFGLILVGIVVKFVYDGDDTIIK